MNSSDWRLRGQDAYLSGKTLYYREWDELREGCDHDHCEFCWDKFSKLPDTLHKGYVTEDGRYWICDDCYNCFKETFGWMLIEKDFPKN